MRATLLFALVVACSSESKDAASASSGLVDPGLDRAITDALAAEDVVGHTGVAVAAIANGRVVHLAGYGWRDREAELPFLPDTLCPIGSNTKAFTAFALALLVDSGDLDWNTPVRTYLPAFGLDDATAGAQATLVDLLAHRTGIPRHDLVWYLGQYTPAELMARLPYLEDDPTTPFRDSFSYNNLMYLTAGAVQEVGSGDGWADFVERRILTPLGMSATVAGEEAVLAVPNHALPYVADHLLPFHSTDAVAPAGALSSTAADLAKWLQMHLAGGVTASGERLLSEAGLAELYASHNPLATGFWYGLGFEVHQLSSYRLIQHGGSIDGYYALTSFSPELGIGLAVLTNSGGGPIVGPVASAAYGELLARFTSLDGAAIAEAVDYYGGLPHDWPVPSDPAPVSLDGALLTATFRHPGYGDVDLIQLPDTSFVWRYFDTVSHLTRVTDTDYTIELPLGGTVAVAPVTFEVSGVDVTAFTMPLGSAAKPSRFVRLP